MRRSINATTAATFVSGKSSTKQNYRPSSGWQETKRLSARYCEPAGGAKGFDLIAQIIAELEKRDIQLVVLGTGEAQFEEMFRWYGRNHADKFSANICFDNVLAHKIYAACDAFLMPSQLSRAA